MKFCLDCKAPPEPLFLWVDDDLWEKMGCGPKDYLCAHCVVERLRSVTTYIYAIHKRSGTAKIKAARMVIEAQQIV